MKPNTTLKFVKKPPVPKLRTVYRANIYAHAINFIINISMFVYTNDVFFIWLQFASVSFIGVNSTKSPKIVDVNMLNHFIAVMIFYLLSLLTESNQLLYLILIFIFTYSFFILRGNGYTKSFNLWMYIQALLIGTAFTTYPFSLKIYATIIAFIEAIIILNLTLFIFNNQTKHDEEKHYLNILKLPVERWLDIRHETVKMAIRGAFTATLLYAICSTFNDTKPNWAVVTAISCLTRDDTKASIKAMKGIFIGTLIGWPICLAIASYLDNDTKLITFMIWLFLLLGIIYSFEATIKPRLTASILTTLSLLITVACISVALHLNELRYINLKVFNTFAGVIFALISLVVWEKLHHIFKEVEN